MEPLENPDSYSVTFHKIGTNYQGKLEAIVSDGFVPESGHRFFILKDATRFEIPVTDMEFEFSKERGLSIEAQAREERLRKAKEPQPS